MADYFCDHGAYSSVLGTTPTWGVPQEGDGTSKDAATASATGSIAFASVPTTGTISVCGASISTTGVIGAASADAAANALATNINATTTAVSTTFALALAPAAAKQLRNIVYARGPANGAPAGTCQIMSRIGTTMHNATAIATTFDGSPTLTQFTGGSGGCWGWFVNDVALGVSSSIAIASYGSFVYAPTCGAVPTINDTVWVRTGGGASKTMTFTAPSYGTMSFTHAEFSTTLKFDTNTKWTGDSATGKVKLALIGAYSGNHQLMLTGTAGHYNAYIALRKGGFEVDFATGTQSAFIQTGGAGGSAGSVYLYGVKYIDSGTVQPTNFYLASAAAYKQTFHLSNCEYVIPQSRGSVRPFVSLSNYTSDATATFEGCTFDFNISSLTDPGALVFINGSYRFESHLAFLGCQFKGFSSGYTLLGNDIVNWAGTDAPYRVLVDNCTGLKLPENFAGLPGSLLQRSQGHRQIVFNHITPDGLPESRVEDTRGVVEWLPNAAPSFPTLSSTLQATGAAWSLRAIWLSSVPLSRGCSFAVPLRMVNQLADGSRTFTLELFMPSSIADGVEAGFSYIGADGVPRTDTALDPVSSAVTWTGAGSFAGYVSKKLTVASSASVKGGTEVVCNLRFVKTAPSSRVDVYIDPEFKVE